MRIYFLEGIDLGMDFRNEKDFLESLSYSYRNEQSPISQWSIDSYIKIYKSFMEDSTFKRGLELGCSNGYSTECLSKLLGQLDVVDGSENMIDKASARVHGNNIKFKYALFEELDGIEEYDYIFCSYVLEHVLEPEKIIERCYDELRHNGLMFITVPNALALSRQMALEMGIIEDLYALTENDMAHGHRRVYDMNLLRELVEKSPLHLMDIGGTFLKPYADFQLNQMITQNIIGREQLKGMQSMALRYPNISGSIYAVLLKNK